MTATKLNRSIFQNSQRKLAVLAFLLLVSLVLAGCASAEKTTTQDAKTEATPFRPAPAQKTTPTVSAVTPTSEAVKPAATPACLDNLTWVTDVTIPDGTEVEAKSTLDKRWEVKNSGNCNWDEHYRLRLKAGPGMDADQEQALYPARSGANAVLRIVFKAPSQAGNYRSAWQAYNPDGHAFGDPIFIDIIVK